MRLCPKELVGEREVDDYSPESCVQWHTSKTLPWVGFPAHVPPYLHSWPTSNFQPLCVFAWGFLWPLIPKYPLIFLPVQQFWRMTKSFFYIPSLLFFPCWKSLVLRMGRIRVNSQSQSIFLFAPGFAQMLGCCFNMSIVDYLVEIKICILRSLI